MVFLFFFFFKGKISQFRTQCFKFFPNSRLSRHVKSSQVCRTLHFRHRSTGKQSSLPSSRFSRIPWNSRPTNDHRYFSSSQKSSINNTNLPYQCVHRSPNLLSLLTALINENFIRQVNFPTLDISYHLRSFTFPLRPPR